MSIGKEDSRLYKLEDKAFVFLNKPVDGIFLCHSVLEADSWWSNLSSSDSISRSNEDHEKVHAKNTLNRKKVVLESVSLRDYWDKAMKWMWIAIYLFQDRTSNQGRYVR